jgi:hypothetical protein
MKFCLDEDLAPQIAARLRKMGLDAVSALEVGNAQLPDRDQLRFASAVSWSLPAATCRLPAVLSPDPSYGIRMSRSLRHTRTMRTLSLSTR